MRKGKVVFTGEPEPQRYWPSSGDSVAIADFSNIKTAGTFYLRLNDTVISHPIHIEHNPYKTIGEAAIKSYYFNRTFIGIDSIHGGKWSRPAGHPDTVVYIHASAASKQRPEGTVVSSPLGWYDAGDYNKYVVNSGISTYTLLRAVDDYSQYYKQQNLNIPESKNALPDLLDETLFNLRWMITMQDPNDGGVYHKLTNKHFDGFVMPHQATEPRYMVMKTTSATLNYAATLAKAARTIKPWSKHLPGLADSCLQGAEKAWEFALKNPTIVYDQPQDITTGAYGDNALNDEWYWAACEMYLSTGQNKYIPIIKDKFKSYGVPTWGNTGTLGTLSLLDASNGIKAPLEDLNILGQIKELADKLLTAEMESAYRVSIENFAWGSNSDVANHGMLKLIAYKHTGNTAYLHSAKNDADYLLGRNATGFCFVTGFGSKRVMQIHHRPSAADGIEEPVPGYLAGGPNLSVLDDCGADVFRSPFPAKSYVDELCSYSTNEMAINWNAPLVYLLNGLAYYQSNDLITPKVLSN
jgi:endoglucanase